IVCRLLWLAAIMAALCNAVVASAGWQWPVSIVIALLTLVATLYVYLGGFRAVVWSGVIQALVMLLGSAAVIGAVWIATRGGPAKVAEVASHLGRLQGMDAGFRWADPWTIWGVVPHWLVISLLLCTADQVTVQRLLFAKDVNHARTSYLVGVVILTMLLSAASYIGLCLLAFYHDHPSDLEAEWVVNLDGATGQPIRDKADRPLLDPHSPAQKITPQN